MTIERTRNAGCLDIALEPATKHACAIFLAHFYSNTFRLTMKSTLNLSRRERQIVELLYRLEEASVADVQAAMDDPPSYSSVRAMLTELVRKHQVTFRQDGKRYLYRPKKAREKVGRNMLFGVVQNFFRGRPSDAICTLLDAHRDQLTDEEIKRIRDQIDKAERGRSHE
jgi:predicted transcriptional regulator